MYVRGGHFKDILRQSVLRGTIHLTIARETNTVRDFSRLATSENIQRELEIEMLGSAGENEINYVHTLRMYMRACVLYTYVRTYVHTTYVRAYNTYVTYVRARAVLTAATAYMRVSKHANTLRKKIFKHCRTTCCAPTPHACMHACTCARMYMHR